jgi:hypothetical protein
MYKLIYDKEKQHATATQKKYFNLAIEYALKNNLDVVRVNKTIYKFNFNNSIVEISCKPYKDWNNTTIQDYFICKFIEI